MSIPAENFPLIEATINRLATESVLAQVGSDEGLVPSYSLLGELREHFSLVPDLRDRVATLGVRLERILDAAQPFDAPTLEALRALVEWLPGALSALAQGRAVSEPAAAAVTPGPVKPDSTDRLLELNLDENRDLLVEFFSEAMDHLQQIEAALLALDHEPGDPEALSSIFRSFHTIKGNAGFLGLVPMHTLAHEVESLLDLARNRKLVLNAAIVTEILRSRDALSALTQQVAVALEKGKLPEEIIPVSHLIRAVKALSVTPAAPAGEIVSATVANAAPPPIEPGSAAPVVGAEVTEAGTEAALAVEPEGTIVHLPPAGLASTATAGTPPPSPESTGPRANLREAGPGSPAAEAKVGAAGGRNTVRVNTEKLDSLMDVVGELVIVQSQLLESSRTAGIDGTLQRNVAQLSRITKELQHTAMSLRMIPIKPTFQKMERLSRDLARDFGKKVNFVTSGEDTELDRTVVEEIGDPLVHMVRNALDHGLESPEARRAGGKSEAGTLHLKAYHQGSNIVIELQDDGRGLNPERILKKAVEKGLVAPDAQLSTEEIHALIFAAGFSTAEKVTSVSGRGVGMDVVKRNIEKLRGTIEIASVPGQGSVFKIKLPLTMAIIDGLVVRVGSDRFILPSTSVQMALRPLRESISTVQGSGEVLDLRGRLLPLHRLHRRFGIPAESEQPWDGMVVIVEHSGRVSALLVDEMVSKQEVVIKNLGAFMRNLPGVAGGAILGDGSIALILDPGTLLQAA